MKEDAEMDTMRRYVQMMILKHNQIYQKYYSQNTPWNTHL